MRTNFQSTPNRFIQVHAKIPNHNKARRADIQ